MKKVTARPDGKLRGGFLKKRHSDGSITAEFPPIGNVKVQEWVLSKNHDVSLT